MKVAPTPHTDVGWSTEFSTLEEQQNVLRALGIDPVGTKAQALIAKHGHTLYLALQGRNAPLLIRDDGNGGVTIEKHPRARGQTVDKPLPPGFGELALALADAAPVQALPLLATALDCPAPPVTWVAVEQASTLAQEASQRPATTTTTTTTITATTTATATTTTRQTTQTTPGNTTTTLAVAATTTALSGLALQPGSTTLSVQAQAVQQANDEGPKKMVDAIEADDPKKVLAVLLLSPLLNGAVLDGATPLQLAARVGKLKVVDYLLKHPGILRNKAGKGGWTALQEAARSGHVRVVERLLKERKVRTVTQLPSGATPFFTAIEHGHLKVARLFLDRERKVAKLLREKKGSPLVNAGSCASRAAKEGVTPLHVACRSGSLETVQWLLAQPETGQYNGKQIGLAALLNTATHAGETPLLLAATSGQTALVKYLLKQPGINVRQANRNGDTVVLLASQHNQWSVAQLLLDQGADIGQCTKEGFAPLHFACLNGELEAVQWLLDRPAIWLHNGHHRTMAAVLNQSTRDGSTPLFLAVRSRHASLVAHLLNLGHVHPNKANKEGFTPLHEAVLTGHIDLARILLAYPDTEVNCASHAELTPFWLAVHHNNLAMAKLLLQHGALINEPTRSGMTPLHHACLNHQVEIVSWLLEQPQVLQQNGRTLELSAVLNQTAGDSNNSLLMCAIGQGQGPELLVMSLLRYPGIDVNLANRDGQTPLHAAVRRGLTLITHQLLAHPKILVDARNASGGTALHAAIEQGHLYLAGLLLHYGADIRRIHEDGATCLHLACKSGSVDTVEWLLTQRSDPPPHGQPGDLPALLNRPNKNGSTPLHVAASLGHSEVVAVLLSQEGIRPNLMDHSGRIPLHLAMHHGNGDVIQQLLDQSPNLIAQRLPADEEA